MLKNISLLLLILLGSITQAQTEYFVQLNQALPQLPPEKQVDTVLAIPFEIMNSQSVETIEKYKYALEISKDIKDENRIGSVYEKMGLAYYYSGEYDASVQAMTRAIESFEKVNNQVRTGSTYASMGYQMKRRNLAKAFYYMRKGIGILKKTEDETALSAAYNNIGVLYQMDKKLDSALYYLYLGYDIVKAKNDSLGIPYSLNNIGQVLMAQKKVDHALASYKEAFEIRRIRNDQNGLAENYGYFGDLYFETNQIEKAIENYLQSLKMSEQIKYTYLSQINSNQLAKAYEEVGDYKKALFYRNKYQKYKDEILNEKSNKAIAQLEIRFDTERKEKELDIKSANIIQEKAKVRKRTSLLIGVSILFVLLLLIALLIYRQLKSRQNHLRKENLLKEIITKEETKNKIYKERMRISRDLHDNIGSQLTFLISSMDNMKYISNENKLKYKLNDLTDFTRDTISQLRDTIWAMNKDSLSIKDLQARIESFIEVAQNNTQNIDFSFVKDTFDLNYKFTTVQGIGLFRILQESVNNSIKYAQSTKIQIQIKNNENTIDFSVSDNGIGFDLQEVNFGFGLKNVRVRAEEINALFTLSTEINRGTSITISIKKDKTNDL